MKEYFSLHVIHHRKNFCFFCLFHLTSNKCTVERGTGLCSGDQLKLDNSFSWNNQTEYEDHCCYRPCCCFCCCCCYCFVVPFVAPTHSSSFHSNNTQVGKIWCELHFFNFTESFFKRVCICTCMFPALYISGDTSRIEEKVLLVNKWLRVTFVRNTPCLVHTSETSATDRDIKMHTLLYFRKTLSRSIYAQLLVPQIVDFFILC